MAYPDLLDLVRDYLATAHTPTPVVSRVPATRPAKFVQLRHVGGGDLRPVRVAERLDVFTWGADEADASALARAVRLNVHALAGTSTLGIMCYRVDELLAPRQFDDLQTGAFRWWATYTFQIRANDAVAH